MRPSNMTEFILNYWLEIAVITCLWLPVLAVFGVLKFFDSGANPSRPRPQGADDIDALAPQSTIGKAYRSGVLS